MRPLDGLVVVDLSRYLPGPLAGQILASLGARVIKVEEPVWGDPVRLAPPLQRGTSALAALLLSGVESLALDLKKPAARRSLELLLAEADFLLETFRPGTLKRFGLAPEELRERFPRLILCSLSGFGQSGPEAGRAGHDLTYQAAAGSLASTASMPALPSADILGAWSAVASMLAALEQRHRTAEGCWIDASLFDAAAHSNLASWAGEAGGAKAVGEPHDLAGGLVCYDLYEAKDGGLVALALLERRFWQRFCDALGRKDLEKLHLARDKGARNQVAALMTSRGRQEWADFFQHHDLPGEAVRSPAEALAGPQMLHRGVVQRGGDDLLRLAYPALFDGQRPAADAAFPALGEHTAPILEQLDPEGHHGLKAGRRTGIGKRWNWRRWLLSLRPGRK